MTRIVQARDKLAAAPTFYHEVNDEVAVFEAAFLGHLAVMLKGPTGCGKTRLVEHMADRLSVPLHTVACHEDTTASDLVGRYMLINGSTEWVDGPLTIAAEQGGICYLDEIVEARADSTVVIHSLTDHRRELTLDGRTGRRIRAADDFCLVVSYNPGYQSLLKDLKVSTRQRMVAIELDFPPPAIEVEIVATEASVPVETAEKLVNLGQTIRRLEDSEIREVASTRTLVAAATLMSNGLSAQQAALAAITGPLTDDESASHGLRTIVEAFFPPGVAVQLGCD